MRSRDKTPRGSYRRRLIQQNILILYIRIQNTSANRFYWSYYRENDHGWKREIAGDSDGNDRDDWW